MTLDLKPAFEIALHVHGSQRDKGGEPYMGHICRVMSAVETDEERAVAILHDAIEDAKPNEQISVGRYIYRGFGERVGDACLALTHLPHENYLDYIKRLSANPLAVRVKLADLNDNMRADRLLKLPPEDRVRLLKKYQEAYEFLRKVGQ